MKNGPPNLDDVMRNDLIVSVISIVELLNHTATTSFGRRKMKLLSMAIHEEKTTLNRVFQSLLHNCGSVMREFKAMELKEGIRRCVKV